MGSVYRARHRYLDVVRALKVLPPALAQEGGFRERFQREAQISADLRHPGIVCIHDYGEDNGMFYLVMDLIRGQSLQKLLEQEAPLPLSRALPMLAQVAMALDFMHEQGVIHRDLKASNLIVGPDDTVTLVDFGIARPAESGSITTTGVLMGTPEYVSPESIEGKSSGISSDLYALGVVAYEMLCGALPFRATQVSRLLYIVAHEPPTRPSLLNPALPSPAERVLLRQLDKTPAARFPNAASFVAALWQSDTHHLGPVPPQLVEAAKSSNGIAKHNPEAKLATPNGTVVPSYSSADSFSQMPSVPKRRSGGRNGIIALTIVAILVLAGAGVAGAVANGLVIPPWQTAAQAPDSAFSAPSSVGSGPQGNLIVADTANNRIVEMLPSGELTLVWGSKGTDAGQFNTPKALAVDMNGNIFVADTGNHRIQKYSPNGQLLATWGGKGIGLGQFQSPSGIAVDRAGNIYVSDTGNNRIQKLSQSGEPVATWGGQGSGPGQFDKPLGLAVDAKGNIYVADSGNNRVQKLSAKGEAISTWGEKGSGQNQLSDPADVALDEAGNIFIADKGNSRIVELDSDGKFKRTFGTAGRANAQFTQPEGITVDKEGNLLVADTGNNRIQMLDPYGELLGAWGHTAR